MFEDEVPVLDVMGNPKVREDGSPLTMPRSFATAYGVPFVDDQELPDQLDMSSVAPPPSPPLPMQEAPVEELPPQPEIQAAPPQPETSLPLKSVQVKRSVEVTPGSKLRQGKALGTDFDSIQGKYDENAAEQQGLVEEQTAVEAQKAQREAAIKEDVAQKKQAAQLQAIDEVQEADAIYKEEAAKIDEAQKAIPKVDQGRYWANMSDGRKAASLISIALGGFLEGFTRGDLKNNALSIFLSNIDRDINLQEKEIEQARDDNRLQRNALYQEWQRTGSKNEAIRNLTLSQYDSYLEEAQAALAKTTEGSLVNLKGKQAVAQLKKGRIDLEAKLREQAFTERMEIRKDERAGAQLALETRKTTSSIAVDNAQIEKLKKDMANKTGVKPESIIMNPKKLEAIGIMTAGSEKTQQAVSDAVRATYSFDEKFANYAKALEEYGGRIWGDAIVSDRAKEIESMQEDLINTMAIMRSGGGRSMSDTDKSAAKDYFPKAAKLFMADPTRAYESLRKNMFNDVNQGLRSVGIEYDITQDMNTFKPKGASTAETRERDRKLGILPTTSSDDQWTYTSFEQRNASLPENKPKLGGGR